MPSSKLVPLAGSERHPAPGARVAGPVAPDQPIEVRITLKAPASLRHRADELASQPLSERHYLSREEFARTFGARDAAVAKVEEFAREHNLTVSRVDRAQNAVYLSGTARDINSAFHTNLELYEQPGGMTYRGRTGTLELPQDLAEEIVNVSGLDQRPVADSKMRVRPPAPHAGPTEEYTPQQVASLYSFPSAANAGHGQCIAIVELGGGFKQTDLDTFFGAGGPKVTAVSVDGGKNAPTGQTDGPDGEVMLDIEVAGALAPGAAIAVYFAPNTNKGFMDAIGAAVHDNTRKPSVVSISWGSAEDGGGYTTADLNAFDQVFQAAETMGVTILAASGDDGSGDGVSSGDHVDFPASSPRVTGCGGTKLLSPDKKTIQSETVWNEGTQGGATGGGVSKTFPVPTYQKGLTVMRADKTTAPLAGRGVPDIAANADPYTGYDVLVDGQRFPIGGTSAVAPLLAGLVAVLNQQIGKPVGFWNPFLYGAIGTAALRDITSGNNGTFAAARGWDACTGTGVPVGTGMLAALQAALKK